MTFILENKISQSMKKYNICEYMYIFLTYISYYKSFFLDSFIICDNFSSKFDRLK